ncbi:MAG: hypothetical protein KBC33_03620 [Candidatus Pacebacteria bacterium]|nr:hypothetical protein [Candidatus Paceibacterota bacterium]
MIQQDLATTKDLKDLKSHIDDGFEKTNEHIDNLEIGIGREMKKHKEEIKAHFEHSIGMMYEKFQGDLKVVSEYLGGRIDNHDKRFEDHDKRFDDHDSRFDRLESKIDLILEKVQK